MNSIGRLGRYLEAEQAIFEELRTHVTQRLDAEERVPANRYFDGQPRLSRALRHDWNRSYTLEPAGHPGRRRRPAAWPDRFAL